MTDSVAKAEAVDVVDVETDIETGGIDEDEGEDAPNQKTCYTPMVPILKQANELYEQKIHPAILPLQEKVTPVIIKVGDFFDDDEEDPLSQEETTDDDGNVVQNDTTLFKVSPSCFGAAVLGFSVTSLVIGPLFAVAAGAGCAYATSRQDTKAGEYSNFYGKKTYNGLFRGYKHSKKALHALKGKIISATAGDENATAAASSLEAA